MHIGYQDWQNPVSSSNAALQMSQKIVELSEIKPEQSILDAGCGVGILAFEINSIEPAAKVYGIDILINNIHLANQYNEHERSPYPIFSVQDYEHIAFRSEIFDRIIFCESFIHSQNKKGLIQESNRTLKSKGRITIADILMHTDKLTKEETDIIEGLKAHMYIPNIIHIQELIILLFLNDFSCINPRDVTENVIAPQHYFPSDSQNIGAKDPPQDIEALLTGLQNLLRDGKAGYYILTAQKV